jgi:Protein of unknown function (DUF4031)
MTVYVDDVRLPFGNMVMCHLWADTEAELLAMVDRIGVRRQWIQGHPKLSLPRYRNASWVHFDITSSKKRLALAAGAKLTDKYGPSEHCAKEDIASGHPGRVARGQEILTRIARARVREVMQS